MEGFEQAPGRWFVGGCLSIFAIPFFIAGVSVLRTGIAATQHGDSRGGAILIATGLAFTVFSAGFAAMVWFNLRQGQAAARRMQLYAAQPWLWREDWASRRIVEGTSRPIAALWIFALMWNAIVIPMLLTAGTQFRENNAVAVAWLFGGIGVVLLAGAAYRSLQQHKFGKSVCTIDKLPVEPGQTLSGTIEHRGSEVPEAGYRVRLACINRVITGAGRNRSTTDTVLWDTEQRISGGVAAPSPEGMSIPFSFDIPDDQPATDSRNRTDSILWQLQATAELPGIDYKATFDLPVFATAERVAAHDAARREEVARHALPSGSRVSETPLPGGGVELRVRSPRKVSSLAVAFVIAVIWFGAIALMWTTGAPGFFDVVFSLFGLLILGMAIDFFAGSWSVTADRAALQARHAIFGVGVRSKSLDAGEIAAIEPKVGGHVGHRPFFDVEARLTNGSKRTLVRYLEDRSDAEAVAAKLWSALGR